nr:AV2 protein [Conyza yellow vein virus]
MWDPLENDFAHTVHGFRCMLAVKYLLCIEKLYSPDTLGGELIRELIQTLRCKNYVEASSRYSDIYSRIQGSSSSQLRESLHVTCNCSVCPYKQKTVMGQQAHVQEAQTIQAVQDP